MKKNNEPTDEATNEDVLSKIMGVKEAAELWGYANPDSVKRLCAEGKVKAKKVGKTWVIDRNQPNPKERRLRVEKVLVGQVGADEWFLENPGIEIEEGMELIEGTFSGQGLTGWFCDSDSGLYIEVVDGRTCGRWVEEPDGED
jgi:hypothetical protein